jgi:hypothetical protein
VFAVNPLDRDIPVPGQVKDLLQRAGKTAGSDKNFVDWLVGQQRLPYGVATGNDVVQDGSSAFLRWSRLQYLVLSSVMVFH